MFSINATVTRGEKWWVAEFVIDGHEYGTQAKHLSQIPAQVADAAALMTDLPVEDFAVAITASEPAWVELIEQYQQANADLKRAQDEVRAASRQAVTELQAQGLSGRDVATLMGISPQRVSQLAA